jgi:hypothetical protein
MLAIAQALWRHLAGYRELRSRIRNLSKSVALAERMVDEMIKRRWN